MASLPRCIPKGSRKSFAKCLLVSTSTYCSRLLILMYTMYWCCLHALLSITKQRRCLARHSPSRSPKLLNSKVKEVRTPTCKALKGIQKETRRYVTVGDSSLLAGPQVSDYSGSYRLQVNIQQRLINLAQDLARSLFSILFPFRSCVVLWRTPQSDHDDLARNTASPNQK